MNARFLPLLAGLGSVGLPSHVVATQDCIDPRSGPYNILLIVLDDVGTDKLALYGETPGSNAGQPCALPPTCYPTPCPEPFPYPPTPHLDALAGCGIQFTNFYVNPLCSTTRAALMTGRYAFRNGIGGLVSADSKLDDSEVFLPEYLRHGFDGTSPYKCGAFGKWHLTYPEGNETHPIDNGFDVFAGHMGNNQGPGCIDHFKWLKVVSCGDPSGFCTVPYNSPEDCSAPTDLTESSFDASVTRADALAWINGLPHSQRFFAYVAFNAPHAPYQVPPFSLVSEETQDYLTCQQPWGGPHAAGDTADLYDQSDVEEKVFYRAMLEAVDTEIGNLIDGINAFQKRRTVVIVVSDNGTPRHVIDSPAHNPGHGKSFVYQLGIRTPMIVSGALVDEADHGAVCPSLVGAVDLFRTIGDIAWASEGEYAENVGPLPYNDGSSFLSLILDPSSEPTRAYAFSQKFNPNVPYAYTDEGPYDIGCYPPPAPPDLWCCNRVIFQYGHDRAITNGIYKLIVKQCDPGSDGGNCDADTPPTYDRTPACETGKDELYEIDVLDPIESPATNLIDDPTYDAIEAELRDAMRAIESSGP